MSEPEAPESKTEDSQADDSESQGPEASQSAQQKKPRPLWQKIFPWAITIVCFGYLYSRIASRTPEGETVVSYLADVFGTVNWLAWLAIMVPYSILYLLIDTAVLWRVLK